MHSVISSAIVHSVIPLSCPPVQLVVAVDDHRSQELVASRSATATVTLAVKSDRELPMFLYTPYKANIDYDWAVGRSVHTASAVDNDLIVRW